MPLPFRGIHGLSPYCIGLNEERKRGRERERERWWRTELDAQARGFGGAAGQEGGVYEHALCAGGGRYGGEEQPGGAGRRREGVELCVDLCYEPGDHSCGGRVYVAR